MNDFNSLFPNFLTAAHELRTLLLPVAFILFVTGFVIAVANAGRSIRGLLYPLVRICALTAVLTQLPAWGGELSKVTNHVVVNVLHADPAAVHAKYQASLQAQKGSDSKGWWEKVFDVKASFFEGFISGILFLFGLFAGLIVFYSYLVQTFILYVAYAISPIFIGFLAVRGLSSIGSHFVLGLVGMICWPLGWGCASLLTDGLISFMTDRSFLAGPIPNTDAYGLQNLIGVAAIAIWLITSTIAAPIIIQKAISTGAQIGGALLSVAATAGTNALGTAATTSSAISGIGANTLDQDKFNQRAGVLGGIAGLMALTGSSVSGSSHSPGAAAFASLGTMMKPKQAKPPDNEQQEPASSNPPPYNPEDPANDKLVKAMLRKSGL